MHIALSDTLETLNWERFSTRTDLYYQELESDKYDFSKTVHIPAGSDVGLLDINFFFERSGYGKQMGFTSNCRRRRVLQKTSAQKLCDGIIESNSI